jgi:nucleoid-associated protein YgaU
VASTTTTTPPAQTPPRAASGVIDADEIVGPPSTATSSTGTTSPGWSTVQPPVDSTGVARTSPTSPTVVRPNPIPATPPADPVAESYTVKTGDSFAAISETYYGTQRYAEFLMQANPQVTRANALRPGMVLKIPAKPQSQSATVAAATKPAEKPATPQVASDGTKLYVVVANDTFYGIAERELGSASRWKEIYELNKERVGNDPKSLYPGMKLRMPETVRRVPAPQAASASSPAVPAKPVGLTATTPVPNSQ